MRGTTPTVAARARSRGLALALLGLAEASGCRPLPSTPPAPQPEQAPLPGEPAPSVAPTILSAHLARLDDPELGGKDGLVVVLDAELDAASLHGRAFVVVRADDGPVAPERAILAPASEDDENRTVLLVGELGAAGAEPTHVAVVGPLWSEDGRSLRGLGAPIEPFAAGPRAVAAEVLAAGPGRCEGAAQVVRTYWSDELRGVEPEDLSRVRVVAGEGASSSPVRFDDHAPSHGEAGQDGVLDLCLAEPARPRRVSIEAAAFRSPSGHASAAVELAITER